MIKPIPIVGGGSGLYDPPVDATTLYIPALAGQDVWVERTGYGTLNPSSYTVVGDGHINLLGGLKVGLNDQYFIHLTGLQLPGTPGSYSNGFKSTVINALLFRLGWIQPTRTGFTLDSLNTTSISGRYFNDDSFHAIVTPERIRQAQEDPDITQGEFNAKLLTMQKACISKALTAVFNKSERLERTLMFERFGRNDYKKDNTGAFVGVLLRPGRNEGLSIQVNSVSLYFDSNVTFPLYLFHEAKKTPVWSQNVTAVADEQTVVNFSEVIVNYLENNKSGNFYLGYFQSDLGTAKAYNEIVERFNPTYNFAMYPVEMEANGNTINRNKISYTYSTHGFNVDVSAFRDHTQRILTNPYLFDTLVGLNMAAMTVEMINNSDRENKTQRITQEQSSKLYTDLQLAGPTDEFPYMAGLKNQIAREVKRAKEEFFPCEKVQNVEHNTNDLLDYGMQQPDFFRY